MKQFLDQFSLNSILKSQEATFHHNNQTSESQIDHIFSNIINNDFVNIVMAEHLCLKNEPLNFSSHDFLTGSKFEPR